MGSRHVPAYERPAIEDKATTQWHCEHPTSVFGQEFPCGRCTLCLATKTSLKATRVLLEACCHRESVSFTLTYDQEHLPRVPEIIYPAGSDNEPGTGVPTGREVASLSKRDFELFMKRLRKAIDAKFPGTKIRFTAAGEYGSLTARPHYHGLLFGIGLDDVMPLVEKCWGKGHVHFDMNPISPKLAMYVSKHNMKPDLKAKGRNIRGREPEFTKASQGIGRGFVDRIVEAYQKPVGRAYIEKHGDFDNRVRQHGKKMSLDNYMTTKCRERLGIPVLRRDRPSARCERKEHNRLDLKKTAEKIRRQMARKDGKKL